MLKGFLGKANNPFGLLSLNLLDAVLPLLELVHPEAFLKEEPLVHLFDGLINFLKAFVVFVHVKEFQPLPEDITIPSFILSLLQSVAIHLQQLNLLWDHLLLIL